MSLQDAYQRAADGAARQLQREKENGPTRRAVLAGAGAAGATALGLSGLNAADDALEGEGELEYELTEDETARFYPGEVPIQEADYLQVGADIDDETGDVSVALLGYENGGLLEDDELAYADGHTFEGGQGSYTMEHEPHIHVTAHGAAVEAGPSSGDYAEEDMVALEFDWNTAGDN